LQYFAPCELRHTFATRLSAGGVADHMVTQMLRQSDAEVFKLYSQAKLRMMREALAKLASIDAKGVNGERAGTRTPDLLRVKNWRCFQLFHRFSPFSNVSNGLAMLLFPRRVSPAYSADRVLAQF
jgi:hypothetical protein